MRDQLERLADQLADFRQIRDELERLSQQLEDTRAAADRQHVQLDDVLHENAQIRLQLDEAKQQLDDSLVELAQVKHNAEIAAERVDALQNQQARHQGWFDQLLPSLRSWFPGATWQ